MVGYEKFGIQYGRCKIILCEVNEKLNQYGFTAMDGTFFYYAIWQDGITFFNFYFG